MKTLIIIVTYNGVDWLDKCIEPLYDKKNIELFIVDNASSDITCSVIENKYPKSMLVKSDINLGFGKANNIGLEYSIRNKFDFVFLLNQDASISEESLYRLINISIENPTYGIISPVHFKNDNEIENLFSSYLKKTFFKEFIGDQIHAEEIDFVNAALWLIPIEVVKEIGGFNPLFFHYGEDVDYLHRVKYFKYKVVYINGVKGFHYRDYNKNKIRKNASKKMHFGPWPVRYYSIMSNVNATLLSVLISTVGLFVISLIKHLLKRNFNSVKWDLKIGKQVLFKLPEVLKNRKTLKKSGPNFLSIQ